MNNKIFDQEEKDIIIDILETSLVKHEENLNFYLKEKEIHSIDIITEDEIKEATKDLKNRIKVIKKFISKLK